MPDELSPEVLRRTCAADAIGCASSKEMQILETIIGQDRATRSLGFGLGIADQGFNIYVAGPPGTGRTSAVKRFLMELAKDRPVPPDWCYVNNFSDSHRPHALSLPAGKAKTLQADMKSLIQGAQREIKEAFQSEQYLTRREETVKSFEDQRNELLTAAGQRAQKAGFMLQATPVGLVTIPMRDGKPLQEEEFNALSDEEKAKILEQREKLQSEIGATFRQAKRLEESARQAVKELDKQVALYAISHAIDSLKEKYSELPEVLTYLNAVRDDIVENLDLFRKDDEEETPVLPFGLSASREVPLRRYEVNVVVDNSEQHGAPVVIELNPAYGNLFGRIEQEARFGALVTDFTLIRGGSMHQANGGFLVMAVDELLRNALSWESLKRALENRKLAIEDIAERLGFMTTKSLQVEPIPLDVKVLLIGTTDLYDLLRMYDEEFSELFKVKAEFGTLMDRTDQALQEYASFVCTLCEEESLMHLSASALAKVVEHGSRLAEDQEKLSTRFRDIADLIREASYYAKQDGAKLTEPQHVKKAIDERYYRSSLIEERVREYIARGIIMIDTRETRVGQVNGLSVLDLGDIAFGRPSRITVSVGLGREGLVDIEREVKLGGPIHSKGVMIIAGYLAGKYAQKRPLSLSARLVFEQSYGGVEGDSASSTELYALLSGLADIPIKQGIAVTGSVNQKGEVQAIGGVNEKIEGFFEVCRAAGLTGEQGVLIPQSNVSNLMLKEEVVEAVAAGKFHIWAVRTIDEGIEILTGVPAGKRLEDGTFEEGTVNARVDQRLHELAHSMREFARPGKEQDEQ
jgi:lon-related putative ATP-dependent protease